MPTTLALSFQFSLISHYFYYIFPYISLDYNEIINTLLSKREWLSRCAEPSSQNLSSWSLSMLDYNVTLRNKQLVIYGTANLHRIVLVENIFEATG